MERIATAGIITGIVQPAGADDAFSLYLHDQDRGGLVGFFVLYFHILT